MLNTPPGIMLDTLATLFILIFKIKSQGGYYYLHFTDEKNRGTEKLLTLWPSSYSYSVMEAGLKHLSAHSQSWWHQTQEPLRLVLLALCWAAAQGLLTFG